MANRFTRRIFRWFTRYRLARSGPTWYELSADLMSFVTILRRIVQFLIPALAFVLFGILIYDGGFNRFYAVEPLTYQLWFAGLLILEILLIAYFVLSLPEKMNLRSRIFNVLLILLVHNSQRICDALQDGRVVPGDGLYLWLKLVLYTATIVAFVTEASYVLRFVYRRGVNPSFLFLGSFLGLIGAGTLLLLLPNATTQRISFADAWFTAASAICVTGLTVLDTATAFTVTGKVILLCLIQVGGLGIMTFAGLLSYLATGSVSFRNQLALRDMMSSNRIGSVISLVARVVLVTLSFEAVGAFLIFQTVPPGLFDGLRGRIFFSVFHSVSAFCNAGFSTYTNGLYELPVRFNYPMHLVIATLILLGGLGFPIVFRIFSYVRINVNRVFHAAILNRPPRARPIHILDATSKLSLATTVILLLVGFATYYIFEQNASLAQHPTVAGKIVTSVFGSVTPRTAGFNTVDLSGITLPTVMIYLLLMWIGASPGSTGGGIKTTVVAVALLNIRSLAMGNEKVEFSRLEIGAQTISRAFAIIMLSLLVIGITVLILAVNEPEKPLFALAFEAFSAFSTVGLTLGVTPALGVTSKIVISIVMLVGRVGILTVLFAFAPPVRARYHRYPREEISL